MAARRSTRPGCNAVLLLFVVLFSRAAVAQTEYQQLLDTSAAAEEEVKAAVRTAAESAEAIALREQEMQRDAQRHVNQDPAFDALFEEYLFTGRVELGRVVER